MLNKCVEIREQWLTLLWDASLGGCYSVWLVSNLIKDSAIVNCDSRVILTKKLQILCMAQEA